MIIEITTFYRETILAEPLVYLYLASVLVDVITGNFVAIKQRQWNSKTGLNGSLRHFALGSLVMILVPMIKFAIDVPMLAYSILIYIILQYTISILENMNGLGVDLYEGFAKYFKYLKSNPEDKQYDKENK